MSSEESANSAEKRSPNWHFWLWLATATATLVLVTILGTAAVVRHAMLSGERLTEAWAERIVTIASFPGQVNLAVEELISNAKDEPTPLLISRKNIDETNWIRNFPNKEDNGYILFSGVEKLFNKSIIKLIRISDGAILGQWNPDWLAINENINNKKWAPKSTTNSKRAMHPLLLEDGDVIFNTGDALVRIGPCSSRPIWILDEVMHHSIEKDVSGNIWVPSVTTGGFPYNNFLKTKLRDDALALVSTDGNIIERRSFSEILIRNGFEALLLGTSGFRINDDPIHINQIQVATQPSKYWNKGDLLISARHLSTIFLYRPSTGKIYWHKTGPWLNQHSVEFVDTHRISIFNNNVLASAPRNLSFLQPNGFNKFMIYDFDTKTISEPFLSLLEASRLKTITEGRAKLLKDGGLFIEESNNGRHLRFTPEKLLWSRVNDFDLEKIGIVSWSRYLTAQEAAPALAALSPTKCGMTQQ
jgi:hypothetical protein